MTKKSIALIVAGSLVLIGLVIGSIGVFLGGANSVYWTKEGFKLGESNILFGNRSDNVNANSVNIESFNNIDLSVISARVEFVKSDKNMVEYSLSNSEDLVTCEVNNKTLVFRTKARFAISFFAIGFNSEYVTVYYNDDSELQNVSLSSSSGSVNVNDLNASGDINLSSISGSVRADRIKGRNVSVDSTSGSRNISNVTASTLKFSGMSGSIKISEAEIEGAIDLGSVSGSISGNDISCESLVAKNTSGSISFDNVTSNGISAKSASGRVEINGKLAGSTVASSISGSVRISTSLPQSSYGYALSSVSGSTRVNDEKFSGSVNQGSENFIDAKTTSGSVRVNFTNY